MAIIEAEGLTKIYQMGSAQVHALRGVSLRMAEGEFVALMGASGSGKSTLMHLLGCLDRPTTGVYWLEGQDVSMLSHDEQARLRNHSIGFVFQTFNLLSRLSALENVTLPLLYRGRIKAAQEQAMAALERTGLAGRATHRPPELSGGQQQRVAIARALVTNPAIILADEPTGNLDSGTGAEVMQLLLELHGDGRTVLMVTHDMQVAAYAQRTLHIQDGQMSNRGPGDDAL